MQMGQSQMLLPLTLVSIALAAQIPLVKEQSQGSLMDGLFGELVDSEATLDKTAITEYGKGASHLLYASSIKLPDNDDISDINVDQTFFGGILTYAHLPHFSCVSHDDDRPIDIAIMGAPFDTAVSYRPGARFGPEAIRSGARRFGGVGHSSPQTKPGERPQVPYDPESHNFSLVDCGDVPMSPFDNRVALNQLYRAQRATHKRKGNVFSTPKIITMGGDHTIALMALKSVSEKVGPVHVIHFDSHIDTWDPRQLGGGITDYMKLNHGTFLHYAHEKGYVHPDNNYHVGIRAPMVDEVFDRKHDRECGFKTIEATDIDHIGIKGIVNTLKEAFGDEPVYISVDIDVLDPAFAPGTGTMEAGGFTSRELLSILRGLKGLNVVGADVVEVSPPFDTNAEITSLAATFVIDEFLKLMMHIKK
ncbi:hypothetical protein DIURU_002033 [Diutina rugosa]|uniref:Agmatinase n=1 Tax=Diutina rugosa TaxID=5481 RepID=A0A642URT4_DIURU|nr:uncharacterized protein DIURU_002033 [Diutina rugosa]KAA8904081.1 hypothetical protein DIURU_002033 [Diutina rugosa]